MATIRIYDGTNYTDVEVTEEFAAQYEQLEKYEKNINRKETRRHQSLNKSMEHGFDVADPNVNIFEQVERRLWTEKLHKAIVSLSPEQQRLLWQVYFEYIPQAEIAERENVSAVAIHNRLERILARLKKSFENDR